MYIPRLFRQDDPNALFDVIRRHAFGLLVINGSTGPQAAHLPFVVEQGRGVKRTLRCHVARTNPIWQSVEAEPVLAVFSGPHAYISPDWYETPSLVPTWNYVSVHAYGEARLLNDSELLELLGDLSAVNERQLLPKPPWTPDRLDDGFYAELRRAIVGIEIEIVELQGKWKLSQNRAEADRRGALRGLQERGGSDDLAVARYMADDG